MMREEAATRYTELRDDAPTGYGVTTRAKSVALRSAVLATVVLGAGALAVSSSSHTLRATAAVGVGLQATSGTCPTLEYGVDYVASDITNVPGKSAGECCVICSQRTGCGAFTWSNHEGGTCWLKSAKGATVSKSGVISAVLTTPVLPTIGACPSVEQNVDYIGNDIGSIVGSGAADCCSKCNERAGCGAFTWSNYGGGTCWLKSGKGSTTSKSGVVSAVITKTVAACPAVESGVDFLANDIANVPGSGAADCCVKCGQRSDCGAFTWSDYLGGTCWLKSRKGSTALKAGVISAVVTRSSAPVPTVTAPPVTPPPTTKPPSTIQPPSAPLPTTISGGAAKVLPELLDTNGVVGNPQTYPNAGCVQPNYISKNGKLFVVSPSGEAQPMDIKGVNWFGMETSATLPLGLWLNPDNGTTIYAIASFLARNNFNSVRLPICMESLLNNIVPNKDLVNTAYNRAVKLDTYLDAIKSIIKALAYRQISVLLDIHTLTTSDVGTLWYNNQIDESKFMRGIDILTSNLCSNEFYNVIGIDLKNEPASATWGDNSPKDFRAASIRIGDRMLAGCRNWLAFVEGIASGDFWTNSQGRRYWVGDWWGGGLRDAGRYPVTLSVADKVVYSPHYYTPSVYPVEYYYGDSYSELSDAELKENMQATFDLMFGYLARNPTSPAIILGEFGGLYSQDLHPKKTLQRGVAYTVELMKRPGFSGGYAWSLNPESKYDYNPRNTHGFFQEGLLLSDWRTANEPYLAALAPLDQLTNLKPLPCFK